MKVLIWSLLLIVSTSLYATEGNFPKCSLSEKVIFECKINTKRALLCGSYGERVQYYYRFGSPQKTELELPNSADESSNFFRLASHPTPGGNVSYIHFSNNGYEYYFLDDSSKLADKSFSPISQLVIFRGFKKIKSLICENDDSGINEDAYINMSRELYMYPDDKWSHLQKRPLP